MIWTSQEWRLPIGASQSNAVMAAWTDSARTTLESLHAEIEELHREIDGCHKRMKTMIDERDAANARADVAEDECKWRREGRGSDCSTCENNDEDTAKKKLACRGCDASHWEAIA